VGEDELVPERRLGIRVQREQRLLHVLRLQPDHLGRVAVAGRSGARPRVGRDGDRGGGDGGDQGDGCGQPELAVHGNSSPHSVGCGDHARTPPAPCRRPRERTAIVAVIDSDLVLADDDGAAEVG
jgi:hypothetical protein